VFNPGRLCERAEKHLDRGGRRVGRGYRRGGFCPSSFKPGGQWAPTLNSSVVPFWSERGGRGDRGQGPAGHAVEYDAASSPVLVEYVPAREGRFRCQRAKSTYCNGSEGRGREGSAPHGRAITVRKLVASTPA